MKVALRGSYVEFVCYMGITEKYPRWFKKILDDCTYTDDDRYTFYVPPAERTPAYYEKQLIEDYTVFLRKSNGEVHVTDYEVLQHMYTSFKYNAFNNSGLAALDEDTIEYVECRPGILGAEYPEWFYEYFTEVVNFPHDEQTILMADDNEVYVDRHCVFLKNRFGEIKGMYYDDFLKYYDPNPKIGGK